MTGPEHYREAERLLDRATEMEMRLAATKYERDDFTIDMLTIDSTRREADAHATLALAAATAEAGGLDHQPEWREWRDIVLPEDQRGEPS